MANVKDVEDLRHPGAEELLHTPDPARLAYNGPDGFPHVIPIGFLWNGTDIVVCTAGINVRKQPHDYTVEGKI